MCGEAEAAKLKIYGELNTLVFFQQEDRYYGCQLLKSHALLTVNMSKKKKEEAYFIQWAPSIKKYFVLFRYNSELTTHAYAHSQVHTCMLTYTKNRNNTVLHCK